MLCRCNTQEHRCLLQTARKDSPPQEILGPVESHRALPLLLLWPTAACATTAASIRELMKLRIAAILQQFFALTPLLCHRQDIALPSGSSYTRHPHSACMWILRQNIDEENSLQLLDKHACTSPRSATHWDHPAKGAALSFKASTRANVERMQRELQKSKVHAVSDIVIHCFDSIHDESKSLGAPGTVLRWRFWDHTWRMLVTRLASVF